MGNQLYFPSRPRADLLPILPCLNDAEPSQMSQEHPDPAACAGDYDTLIVCGNSSYEKSSLCRDIFIGLNINSGGIHPPGYDGSVKFYVGGDQRKCLVHVTGGFSKLLHSTIDASRTPIAIVVEENTEWETLCQRALWYPERKIAIVHVCRNNQLLKPKFNDISKPDERIKIFFRSCFPDFKVVYELPRNVVDWNRVTSQVDGKDINHLFLMPNDMCYAGHDQENVTNFLLNFFVEQKCDPRKLRNLVDARSSLQPE